MNTPKDNWKIDTEKTALIIIDMQRAFMEPGSPREIPDARRILNGVNEIAMFCRNKNIPVIFIREASRPDLSDMGLMSEIRPMSLDSEFEMIEGRIGADFYPGLDVKDTDYVVTKIRYSSFVAGSSSLEPLLRGLGCDSIMPCGCATVTLSRI
jgi:ureidoacrylate peracid hydrolase